MKKNSDFYQTNGRVLSSLELHWMTRGHREPDVSKKNLSILMDHVGHPELAKDIEGFVVQNDVLFVRLYGVDELVSIQMKPRPEPDYSKYTPNPKYKK